MYYRVLVASQRYHGAESLTYSSDQKLSIGQIVQAPLGKISVLGVVSSTCEKPVFVVKPLERSWDIVVPRTTIELINWLHKYYPAPLGSIVELFTPPAMTQKISEIPDVAKAPTAGGSLPPLTEEQQHALDTITSTASSSVLVHGDTGTGKTRLYIELATRQIQAGKSVILTTPEIGLTRPLVKELTDIFGAHVFVTHSAMTAASRRTQWLAIARSKTPVILIGPRSALFFPVKNLGLIIMDEAHDTAYKQDQSPYYQATRVAAKLADLHSAKLVLGTATPLVSDYFVFKSKARPVVRLTTQAVTSKARAEQVIIDSTDRSNFTQSPYLSDKLLQSVGNALKNNEQSLLFLNRRGSARVILCQSCGWRATCPHCDTSLTFHADTHNMRCHSCEFKDHVPINCPECGSNEILFRAVGTKALEEEITKHFPNATVARFDGDTHKSQSLEKLFDDLKSGEIDIIIGTQAIAKGFDLPKLSVVGVVQADMSLSIPDYTATERTYQLLSQISGRVGRGHRDSTLIIQTHDPKNPTIKLALSKNYIDFYCNEIAERKSYRFPPFAYLMTVTCTRASSKSAETACQKAKTLIEQSITGVSVDGPTPRFVEKLSGKYSWHLVIRAKSRAKLLEAITTLPAGAIPNLDPSDLL